MSFNPRTSKLFRGRNVILGAATLALIAGIAQTAAATAPATSFRYRMTITNVTRGQIFSPSLVIAHDPGASLFTLGQPASGGLSQLAEDGNPSMLAMMMSGNPAVFDVRTTGGPIMPGASLERIFAGRPSDMVSAAGMMVSTNDAFFAIRDVPLPAHGETVLFARAYDAGTEANSEDCAFIPGPPCGNGGVHDPAPAEGYVHVHSGIHGLMSLPPERFDWRDAVAEIRIERL